MVLAVRQNSTTRVERLSGSANAIDMAPLNYVTTKFFSALRAQKGFFGYSDSADGPANLKASLCTQDIRWARNIQRLQRAYKSGVQYLLELNYMLLGGNDPENVRYDFTDPAKAFTVHMGPVTFLVELEFLEVLQLRQQVAAALGDMGRDNPAFKASEWTKYILRDIIKIPQSELSRVLRTADEVVAAQRAILQAKPVDVHTAMPAGVGAQSDLAKRSFGLQADQADQDAKQAAHDRAMEKAAAREQSDESAEDGEDDTVLRVRDAVANVRARGLQSDGDMSPKDLQALSEALSRSPELRRTIEHGALLWREGWEDMPSHHGLTLPDRDSDIFKKGLLDEVTAADIEEAMPAHRGGQDLRAAGRVPGLLVLRLLLRRRRPPRGRGGHGPRARPPVPHRLGEGGPAHAAGR